jgi:hypothetical protein
MVIDQDRENIEKALFKLVCSGDVLAKCPACTIPLSVEELTCLSCEKCGEIDSEEILYVSKAHSPVC